MKQNQVVLIYGMPASGKYTVAQKIQEKCGGILMDNHYFYDLFKGLTDVSDEKWYEYSEYIIAIRKIFLEVLGKYHPQNKHIRYIFTGVIVRGEKFPAELKKFAQNLDADFIPIELNVQPNELLARCDNEQRRKRNKISNKAKYSILLKDWLPRAFHSKSPNRLIINSTNLTPDETFTMVRRHLKKFD